MTYNPSIPRPTDIPAQSQADFLTNFGQLNTIFDVDHVPYDDDDSADRGKHDKSTYIEQSADPATAADELSLYSKDTSGNTRLYLRQENSGTVFQMTGDDPVASTNGSSFLPGGLIIKWGRVTTNGSGVGTATFSFPNNFYSATLTHFKQGGDPNTSFVEFDGTPSKTSGSVKLLNSSGTGFSSIVGWIAIGN